ncbi:YolD-like family protein [Fictibacillus sp. Mic-4]|uniref:YolD-like family protein n=1 Tax=Fictibacillus sp. Mic-4 TaxID=3132826 RepID=UPI003CF3EB91
MPNKLTPGYNLMWESSRMMLPEHREMLIWQKEEMKKVEKPVIDEQRLREFEEIILEAMEFTYILKFTYYRCGFYEELQGYITRIKSYDQELWIVDKDDEVHKLRISDVVDIQVIGSMPRL